MSKQSSGAKLSKVGFSHKLIAWFKDQRRVAKDSVRRLVAKPVNSLVTIAVISIALALPVGFYVTLSNVYDLGERWHASTQISLYLDKRASDAAIENLRLDLSLWPEIEKLIVINKEQALEEFKASSGFADVLKHLDDNPLPVVIEVLPIADYNNSEKAYDLLKKLQQQPLVEMAQLDMEWLQRLSLMLQIGQRLALALVLLLSLGVLLIIGNTIRLEIENRRDEIIVVKLVGGTDAFVRRPFLYSGLWYGLAGGIMASIIVALAWYLLSGPVMKLAGLYHSDYQLQGLSFYDTLSLWGMAGLLGYFGAWLSVSQHLDELEPR